jgi:DNA-binding NarL/FixJ family response regulator
MRAVVVDDWELVAAGVRDVLAEQGVDTVALHRRGTTGLAATEEHGAELLVLGACPDDRLVRLVRLGKALKHRPLVLVLLQGVEHHDVASLLAAGADGVVLRSATGQELGDAVAQLRTGERTVSPALLPVLLGSVTGRHPEPGPLTPRERQVLEQLAQGRTNREIAAALFLGSETVKSHLSRLYAKLEATDRHDAVARALAVGLLG